MDFIDALRQYAVRAEKMRGQIQTEEATKTSLIMPFFQQVFGYDVFNPDEFVPEFIADVGIKKGEKVDYAIFMNGEPMVLVEAKWCGAPLEKHDSQLFRYFVTTKAKFAILTNGIVYKFYTDLDENNKMDLIPFLELDILNIKEALVPELKRFCKANFDAGEIFSRASELRYTSGVKTYFSEQLRDPSDDFVRFFCAQTYDGVKTATVLEKFRPIVKSALNNLIGEMMNERITSALKSEATSASAATITEPDQGSSGDTEVKPVSQAGEDIITGDEMQALYIVKAILMSMINPDRLYIRNLAGIGRSVVVLDDTIRKPIVYLSFISQDKMSVEFMEVGGDKKRRTAYPLVKVDDLLQYREIIMDAVRSYEGMK